MSDKGKAENTESKEKKEQQQPRQKPYCPAPQYPTMQAIDGITFDINDGLRVKMPNRAQRKYRVVFADMDTGNIVYSADAEAGAYIASVKKYHINWKLLIYEQGKYDKAEQALQDYEAMFPDDYMPHALRGMMLITIENQKPQSGRDYRAAQAEYETAGAMLRSSDNTTYYQQLGSLIEDLKKNGWL